MSGYGELRNPLRLVRCGERVTAVHIFHWTKPSATFDEGGPSGATTCSGGVSGVPWRHDEAWTQEGGPVRPVWVHAA